VGHHTAGAVTRAARALIAYLPPQLGDPDEHQTHKWLPAFPSRATAAPSPSPSDRSVCAPLPPAPFLTKSCWPLSCMSAGAG
jgi:hypothetical protein